MVIKMYVLHTMAIILILILNMIINDQAFNDFLVEIRSKINLSKTNDGLIFDYSGHGIKNAIILSNGQSYLIKRINNIFNNKECVFLRNKPKIAIYDCCRGSQTSTTYPATESDNYTMKSQPITKGPNTQKNNWVNQRFHDNSGLAIIFSNFEDYTIADSSDFGGCLTRAIYKVFLNPKKIENISLRDLIISIHRQTKIHAGKGNKEYKISSQLVDFHETLEKKVFFVAN